MLVSKTTFSNKKRLVIHQRRTACTVLLLGLLVATLVGVHPVSAGVEEIRITDLGTGWARDINDLGQVVGWSSGYAFLWTATDGMQTLGTLGGPGSWARSINNLGQVVGGSYTASGAEHAFLWTATDGMLDLGTLPGGTISRAYGINDLGQVVGVGDHAFLWTAADGMLDLGTLPGGTSSDAYGINNLGQVVGWSYGPSVKDAFLWTATDGMKALGTFPSGYWSEAYGINDLGQVVGLYGPDLLRIADRIAFLWTATDGRLDLGTLPGGSRSMAYGINNREQVVGSAPVGGGHAFLWTAADGMLDLGTLPGGTASMAYGINDLGQVVGRAVISGEERAVLWDISFDEPGPTPISLFSDALQILPGAVLLGTLMILRQRKNNSPKE